jgi:anaphase-promoting complex subunit 1
LYQHLKSAHDLTTIGILLGRAVSQRGKKDEADSRTMCLHIPTLLPQNLSVEISLPVQSAAVIGAGLLYQQTQNRLITEMLLS